MHCETAVARTHLGMEYLDIVRSGVRFTQTYIYMYMYIIVPAQTEGLLVCMESPCVTSRCQVWLVHSGVDFPMFDHRTVPFYPNFVVLSDR